MSERKTLKEQIALLANGPASMVIAEMKHSMNEIEQACGLFPNLQELLGDPKNAAIRNIMAEINAIEKHVSPLERLEDSISHLKAINGLQRYRSLESELASPETRPSKLPALRREIQSLKSTYSKEIKTIALNSHEALSLRIKIVGCWSNIAAIEAEFLEDMMLAASTCMITEAQAAHESELIETLQKSIERLKARKAAKTPLQKFRAYESILQVSNLKVLKDSLRLQLADIVRLESIVEKRYETLSHLSSIERDMRSHLSTGAQPPSIPAAAAPDPRDIPSASPAPSARMAFKR